MHMSLVTLLAVISLSWATDRPIIGILSEEVDPKTRPHYSSYIAASYVKAVEQGGARVVPIFINRTLDYYRTLLSSVNGVLLPGGGLNFTNVGGYADAGRIIINYAKMVESYDILDYCDASNLSLPLQFKNMYRMSRLFHRAPTNIIDILSDLPVTYNHHKRCVTEEAIKLYNLDKTYHVLSTSVDRNGKEFISCVETHKYPIAGVQFHPEKIAFEWNFAQNISHTHNALLGARYFMDWLIYEARKNNNSFSDSRVEDASLIYNYNVTYEAGYYEQVYLFK